MVEAREKQEKGARGGRETKRGEKEGETYRNATKGNRGIKEDEATKGDREFVESADHGVSG